MNQQLHYLGNREILHQQIEKDVLGYLLKGGQPIILALAMGMCDEVGE